MKNLKKYKVNPQRAFMYQYYDNHMEKQINYAIQGEEIICYDSGNSKVVDVLMQGGRVPTLNLAQSVDMAVLKGFLTEIVE